MSRAAHFFVDSVIAVGVTVLLVAVFYWRCDNPTAFAVFGLLALAGSLCKVELPDIDGTYSLAFCFVLISIFTFSAPETALLGAVSAAAQCMYRPRHRPRPRTVLFSMSAVAISAVLAEVLYRSALVVLPADVNICAVILAATVYWFINTGLVSAALAMTGEGTLSAVWQRWFLSTLPYYVVGAAVTLPASNTVRTGNWTVTLLVLPALALLYTWWRLAARKAG